MESFSPRFERDKESTGGAINTKLYFWEKFPVLGYRRVGTTKRAGTGTKTKH